MVNKTEIIARAWLIKSKGYKAKEIIKNARGTPDFICSDGKRFEVKFFNGFKLMFTNNQVKYMQPDDIVLIFDREGYVGEFIWKNKERFFIKIYYWDANKDSKICIKDGTKEKLDKLGSKGETYDDIINKLIKQKKK